MMSNSNNSQSTIMFTDIVGYSAMINKDETHALDLLETHDKIIEPIIAKNNGTIIKKIGDAIFAEFPNPSGSINTAIDVQTELLSRNNISDSTDKIIIRIGLHFGQVIRKDDDLFGHDVNLCSRIESIAPRGGIAASCELVNSINGREEIYKREMGYVKLKNITHPHQIYKIYVNSEDYKSESGKKLQQSLKDNGITIVDIDTFSIEETFSLGVLYLNNLGDKNDDSIAYNLTNEIIGDFEYIDTIRASNFNDIIQFKTSDLQFTDIGRKLEVDNILRGSFLKKGDEIELSFDLIDINHGNTIWTDKWKTPMVNNKKIRRKILQTITSNFNLEIPEQLESHYSEEITLNPEALEVYYKGKYISDFIKSGEELKDGKKYLEQSIELDSEFVEAYSEYGLVCERLGKYELAETNLQKAKDIAEKKNDNQGLASIYNVLSILYKTQGKYVKSNEHMEKALEIQLTLNNKLKEALFRSNYASGLNYLNKPDLAMEQIIKAIKIKESLEESHIMGSSYGSMTNTYFKLGDYSKALEYGTKALGAFRKNEMVNFEARVLALIADIYMLLGDYTKMSEYMEEAKIILKDFNEPFLLGKLEFMRSRYSLQKNDFESALEYIDNCIDLFEMSEQKHFIIAAYIEKQLILIANGNEDKAKRLISKIEMIINKIDNPPNRPIINIIKLYLEKKNIEEEFDLNNISGDFEKDIQLSFWFTAKYFSLNDQIDEAKKFQEKAIEIINKSAKKISGEKEREIFTKNEYFNKLTQEDFADKKEKLEEIPAENDSPAVFAFCPSCGFKNENNFAFCPSCGNDLKQ